MDAKAMNEVAKCVFRAGEPHGKITNRWRDVGVAGIRAQMVVVVKVYD